MTSAPLPLQDIDLINPETYRDGPPHDIFRLLRREAPVYWHEGRGFPGFWIITKYEDVIRISRDPQTFISGKGVGMNTDPERADDNITAGRMMLVTDPPRHVRLRRLVNKGFTPRQIAALEPHVREIVTGIIDEASPLGECDFVEDISAKLPLAIICEMMGVPKENWRQIFDWSNRSIGADDPEYQTDPTAQETGRRAQMETFAYFYRLVQERRKEKRDDLVSILSDAEVDDERLSDEDILLFCFLLMVAGNETTRNATTGGMLALIEHPEQRQRLMDDPSLLPSAIEEILRWVSPVMHFARIATQDTEIRGQPIRAGEKVVMWYPAANRDEEIFPDPYTFDVSRMPNEHLAFGIGEHFCLGASLARLELQVMFEELLHRLPDIEPTGPVQRLRSTLVAGIKHMPVRYTAT
ncbi:MAG: cytochrome P450 [Dehalococcoidia bacterium]